MPRPLLRFVYLVALAWSNHDRAFTVATSESSLAGDAHSDTDTGTGTASTAQQQDLLSIYQANEAGQASAFASMREIPEPLNHPTFHAPEAHPPQLPSVDVDYTPNQEAPTIATANDPESAHVNTNDLTTGSQSKDESEDATSRHDLGTSHNLQHQPESSERTSSDDHQSQTDSRDEIVTTPNARNVEVNNEHLQAAAESIKKVIRMTNPHNAPTDTRQIRDANDAHNSATDDTKRDNSNVSGPMPGDKVNDNNFAIRIDNDSSTLHEAEHETEALLVDDDRTLLDIFGESAKEYLTQRVVRESCMHTGLAASVCNIVWLLHAAQTHPDRATIMQIPETDAECVWDWRSLQCEPSCQCAFLFQAGDYHLGRSCRKRTVQLAVCAPTVYIRDQPIPKRILSLVRQTTDIVKDHAQRNAHNVVHMTLRRYAQLQEQVCFDLWSRLQENPTTGGQCWSSVPETTTLPEKILCGRIQGPVCDNAPLPRTRMSPLATSNMDHRRSDRIFADLYEDI
jgi:hypothetical protein